MDQRAWFDYPVGWRANSGFIHARPSTAKASFGHALALHAYTRMELPAQSKDARFLAAVGLESGTPPEASAAVRLMVGDKILAEKKALTPDSDLWKLDLPIPANAQLVLEVDFGANQDVGDKVIFGDARFLLEGTK